MMAFRHGQLLLLSLLTPGSAGAAHGAARAAGDGSALVQESVRLRRRAEEAPEGEGVLDLDGCPAEPSQVEALRSHIGFAGRTGLSRSFGSGISARRKEGQEPMKEIYFMRHAEPKCCVDCGLGPSGREQCEGLKANNTMLRDGLLSSDPSKQVQVIFTSPATRALETAVRLFGEINAPMVIDYRLVEIYGFNVASQCTSCVQRVLQETNRTDIWPQWRLKKEDPVQSNLVSTQDSNVRIAKFKHMLMNRPEERIAVVSHHVLLDNFGLGMTCMNMGETIIKVGLSSEGWFALSPSSCASRRRRWPYGNFRRLAGRGVDLDRAGSEDGEDAEGFEVEEEDGY
mmetsp:Transcript_18953/g.59590  ORF Transcript_18953/g.59590 Transcript_18953/m.59590 type:complete len:342 (+) Transcript_18953:26-1051(+)